MRRLAVALTGALCLAPPALAQSAALPHAVPARSGPYTASLQSPTDRYRHCVLGDCLEAAELRVESADGRRWIVPAGDEAVFEDLTPRFADLDTDGVPEILVVRSYLHQGAALAVVGRRGESWRIVAETPPIGIPGRWLNPAAVADFDGDDRPEIALVRMPHLAGILQTWTYGNGRLTLKAEQPGYSNHRIGSTVLDNAVAVDTDGDGLPELAIPTLDRSSIAILSLKNGITERRRLPLPGRVGEGLKATGAVPNLRLEARLEDGRAATVLP